MATHNGDNTLNFTCEGQEWCCTNRAKFLVESANGSSSYSLERGFGAPDEAVKFYAELGCGANQKKRLIMVDEGKRTMLARTK